jgi:hypothetical protein
MRHRLSTRLLFFYLVALALGTPAVAYASDIVLYASDVTVVKGNWASADTTGAAGGRSMKSSDQGWSTTETPLASPGHYFEATFNAPAGTSYRIWLRLRAAGNSKWNDGVWVQFSDALASGSAMYRIGTTKALLVNLERCSGCGTSGWGWQNTAYWLSQTTAVSFATTGSHTIRVQTREDGVEIDQIVLSPVKYMSSAPGPITNDTTIVPKSTDSTAPPATGTSTPYLGSPFAIPGSIDAAHFDNGGANVAYVDADSGNTGGGFRATDVDLEASEVGGYNVGWTNANEWLAYTVNVASAGAYTAAFRVASVGGGSAQVSFGSPSGVSASFTVPNTNGWQKWTTVYVPLTLAAGKQVMKVRFTSSGINFRSVAWAGTTATGSGQTIMVNAGGDFQAALDSAKPGDTILLQAGATFVGNFKLPFKSGSSTSYITIRSSAPDSALPASNVRMTPAYAAQLPKVRSPNTMPALITAPGAHHYRLQFLEFRANQKGYSDIIALGDGSSAQNALSLVPHHLVLDRLYIHGDPTIGQKRGIALNSASTDIVNSYISDIKEVNSESQAIAGWNGPGPFNITNNYIEGAAINVLFGGADPSIPNLVPSDITLRRNHFNKPLAWRTQNWAIKNLLELKNAQRVKIDGNVFEHNWLAAQSGHGIVLKSVNQGGKAPWSVVQDIEFTNNIVREVSAGMKISRDPSNAIEVNNITIRNNLFDRISGKTYGGNGVFLLVVGGSDITVDHNTVINDGAITLFPDVYQSPRFVFTNNVIMDNAYAIKGSSAAAGTGSITKYFPNSDFRGGIYIGSDPDAYPVSNFYPSSIAAVGFVDFAGRNYRLSSSSIYRNGGTDGKDPGCDFAALAAAQSP